MGRAPCCDKANVKKGPWSPEEDAKLKEYMDKFGTGGNWIALPQKAGLKRCGKSCRLRWLNYLRPNIKHGEFSDEEDRVICTLYSSIGSRWSIIASQLPGRTDNDIKNYWNTKLKKKLMGMVPLNNGKYSQVQLSNTFQAQPHSLSTLYNSLYIQAAKSLSTIDQSISSPHNFLYSNNNENYFPLYNSLYQQNHEGLMDLPYYPGKDNNMMIFGGSEASCSSSDGSCSQISYGKDHIKREEIGCGFLQGFVHNGIEETQKFMIQYHENAAMNGFVDQKGNGELEEVKQLISTGNDSSNSFLFGDENKKHEREMYYF